MKKINNEKINKQNNFATKIPMNGVVENKQMRNTTKSPPAAVAFLDKSSISL